MIRAGRSGRVPLRHGVLRPLRRGPPAYRHGRPLSYTADMVRALPEDGNRYEVVYGELLVTPAPAMARDNPESPAGGCRPVSQNHAIGEVLGSRADISWGHGRAGVARRVRRPPRGAGADARLVPDAGSAARGRDPQSLAAAKHDRFIKRRRCQEAGIPLYWLVDAEERRVEIWTPADTLPGLEHEVLTWQPGGAAEAFSLPLTELFRPL